MPAMPSGRSSRIPLLEALLAIVFALLLTAVTHAAAPTSTGSVGAAARITGRAGS